MISAALAYLDRSRPTSSAGSTVRRGGKAGSFSFKMTWSDGTTTAPPFSTGAALLELGRCSHHGDLASASSNLLAGRKRNT